MRRQQLRRAVKRVFTGQISGEKTNMWQHPQTTSNCYRWQPPYICGHDSLRKWNLLTFHMLS